MTCCTEIDLSENLAYINLWLAGGSLHYKIWSITLLPIANLASMFLKVGNNVAGNNYKQSGYCSFLGKEVAKTLTINHNRQDRKLCLSYGLLLYFLSTGWILFTIYCDFTYFVIVHAQKFMHILSLFYSVHALLTLSLPTPSFDGSRL